MEKLTVIIIAKDEEEMIGPAIRSSSFGDEVLVIDTGSIDKTKTLAKKMGAKVISMGDQGSYSDWRNKGADTAKGEWIFYLDADERVTKKLKDEIRATIAGPSDYSAFAIPRRNFVLATELRHGGWYPDYVKRLFRKSKLIKWEGELHEEPVFDGELGHLSNALIHDKHESIHEMVEKTNKWSEIEGKLMFEANHPPMNVLRFSTAMFREFWYRMVVKMAFLDGKVGIIFAIYQVYSRFVSYAKLWEMQLKKK